MQSRLKPVRILAAVSLLFILFMTVYGCRKEEWNTNPDFRLAFSSDTIIFDTVFTTIGSATQILTVRNTSNAKVNISRVRLAGGAASSYRINIDGISAFEKRDLEIAANDSAFIFVKVTIDPNNSSSPMIDTDSILFETNGNLQDVKLVAWGQDAHFHLDETLKGDVVFGNDKPHVVYGDLTVDSLASLTVEPGARLFFHKNSGLVSKSHSSLHFNGTTDEPVTVRSDNLVQVEKDTVPGQWDGIWLQRGSGAHSFTHTSILNGKYGIWLDGPASYYGPALVMENCVVSNMVNYCLYFSSSHVLMGNCQVSNSGAYTLALEGGGSYDFRHCTFGSYFPFSVRKYPMVYISNYIYDSTGTYVATDLAKAFFGNCVIYGSQSEELEISKKSEAQFNLDFSHSLLRTHYNDSLTNWFTACEFNKEPEFIDAYRNNFQLDTLSPAKDIGSRDIITSSVFNLAYDLKGISRLMDAAPDAGAFERKEN